jgi:hypothetical protein
MRRTVWCLSLLPLAAIALGLVTARPISAAEPVAKPTPAPTHPKHHVVRHGRGYGFLPGYRPPEQIQWEDEVAAWRRGPPGYWYGYPRFYRNQWNGGGFGPCWTQTPIGNVWNCGR